jgi:HD-GYP domain-containing protein (c-di-GMP phosphodiesterase class II)
VTSEQTEKLIDVCLALSSERDREALLSYILDTVMDMTNCDAGTLYLLEEDGLHFTRMVTRSMGVRQGGHDGPITLPPVPLEKSYVCAWAAITGESISVADVHADTHFDFTGSIRYDAMTGYRTKSMLVTPMTDDRGRIIGVMQLINALDASGETIAFDADTEELVKAISSQAAISITNMQYAEQVTALLDSLVGALSAAIDERTPYNANHTRNMVRYGSAFLDWLERTGNSWRFDTDKRRTFLLAVWLHDVGKLVVPLEVMDKSTRLGAAVDDVRARFRLMGLLDRLALLQGGLDERTSADLAEQRRAALALIERVNTAGFISDGDAAAIDALAARTYTDENGETHPWLTKEEHASLSVRRGTLSAAEREIMESHVVVTGRILDMVQFPKSYSDVPRWAAAHHEYVNGKGYPLHLRGEALPPEVRLLTILDVFEALTARDRPYKKPMPPERALDILHSMAAEGSLDAEILDLFEKSKAWEETT